MEEKGRLVLNREQRAAMIGRDGNMQVRQPPGPSLLDKLATRSKAHYSVYASYWVGRGGDFHFSTSVLTSAHFLLPFVVRLGPQHCVGLGTAPGGCNESFNVERLYRLPKNGSLRKKMSADMVPLFPVQWLL